MTIRDAANILGLHHATVYTLVSAGRLGCHRLGMRGGKISISEEHITEYLRSCEQRGGSRNGMSLKWIKD